MAIDRTFSITGHGTVVTGSKLFNALRVHVEANNAILLAERHRHGQSHVSESDNGDFAIVCHHRSP